jgi:GNAT superfamily N-acetyltransferase
MNAIVRSAREQDMDALLTLCAEHAAYERAEFDPVRVKANLIHALWSPSPRAWCWIAETTEPVGYATATVDFSTWRAREFMHMDCLFVRETYRGSGIGALLFEAIKRAARHRGIDELQWQTPDWNIRAAAFYQRFGAVEAMKRRYRLSI